MIEGILLGIGVLFVILSAVVFGVALILIDTENESGKREQRNLGMKAVGLAVIGLLFIAGTSMITIIPAGAVGVKDTFGVVDKDVFNSGLYLKNPFTTVVPMSIKTQKYMDYGTQDVATIVALSNDGLSTTMGIAVNYHLKPDKAAEVYKNVGTNYDSIVLVNPIHSVPRDLISKYDTKTLYSASQEGTTDRAKLEQELYAGITTRLETVGVRDSIEIEQVSIRNIDFPESYKNTITAKMNMDTDIAKKKLEVTLQEMEADRVRAQAQGIADKQRIESDGAAYANERIASSVTKESLQWYAIKMMEAHPGAVYYIPIGSDGQYHPELVQPLPSGQTAS